MYQATLVGNNTSRCHELTGSVESQALGFDIFLGWRCHYIMGNLQSLGGVIANGVMRHPKWLRGVVDLATANYRNRKVFNAFVATRQKDVKAVLMRDADFLVEKPMGPKMLWGAFVLGSDTLAEERQTMIDGLRFIQSRYEAESRRVATRILDNTEGELDLARDYVAGVALSLTEHVMGVPLAGARAKRGLFWHAKGEDAMEIWLRTMGSIIAQGAPAPFTFQAEGERRAVELRNYVAQCLNDKREAAKVGEPETILAYLVQNMESTDAQERNLAGLCVVNFGIIVRAISLTIDQLLNMDDGIERANRLARAGDRDGMRTLWYEAMRFAPALPFLARYCPHDTTMGRGTEDETPVPAGSNVGVSLMHAMMDPSVVSDPDRVSMHRDPSVYMHFGAGAHRCLGEFIADPLMSELMMQLFSRFRLRRIWGPRGQIQYDPFGPAVRHFRVGVTPL